VFVVTLPKIADLEYWVQVLFNFTVDQALRTMQTFQTFLGWKNLVLRFC